MKQHLISSALFLAITACAANQATVDAVAPDLSSEYRSLGAQVDGLKGQLLDASDSLSQARATPDLEDDVAAEALVREIATQMASAEIRLEQIEKEVSSRKFGPVAGVVDAFVPGLGTSALGAVLLWPSRRRRLRYSQALKNASSGNILTAAGELLKAFGISHSTDTSKLAVESEVNKTTTTTPA